MKTNVHFSCTTLNNTGKQGILTPDEDGYYTMPIGGLNVFNSVGQYYTLDGARHLFESSSSAFQRRVKSGCLKGESGHPKRLPNQSFDDFANRIMTIDERNICAHFSEVWLDFKGEVKDKLGRPIIAIMAKVAPSGPNGPALKLSLENRKEEVCFSIRAWTDDKNVQGVTHRVLKEIITFDNVTEPGIETAKKFYAPALEALTTTEDHEFSREQLYNALKLPMPNRGQQVSREEMSLATESGMRNGLALFEALGWDFDKKDIPAWMKW